MSAQAFENPVGERQGGGQPRGFDTEEIHHAGQAMLIRPLDHEIRRPVIGPVDTGADAGIGGREARGVQSGPPLPDGLGKGGSQRFRYRPFQGSTQCASGPKRA